MDKEQFTNASQELINNAAVIAINLKKSGINAHTYARRGACHRIFAVPYGKMKAFPFRRFQAS